ncbi:hypothetical protein ACTA71_007139 [Dictyostelium dimigraforme]
METENKKTVCIIGGGPSGLTSCKSALEAGLLPTLLEKNSTIGGVWSMDSKKPWDSMMANTSIFSMVFSDFDHPDSQDHFLSQRKLYEYLSKYCNEFGLERYMKLSCFVEKVVQIADERWLVQWKNLFTNEIDSKVYDFLIVCGGLNNKPREFPMKPLKDFTGGFIYSKDYKSPHFYNNKRVLIVGKSCSGLQIASEVCNSGAKSVHIMGKDVKNQWIVAGSNNRIKNLFKGIGNQEDDVSVPTDFAFLIRSNVYPPIGVPEQYINIEINKMFKQITDNNYNIDGFGNDEVEFDKPPQFVFSSDCCYMDDIKQNKIKRLSNYYINSSNGKEIELINEKNDESINLEFDEIIFATGYTTNLSFFEKSTLDSISFKKNDSYLPCLLYNFTFPHNVKNLNFVGLYSTGSYVSTRQTKK